MACANVIKSFFKYVSCLFLLFAYAYCQDSHDTFNNTIQKSDKEVWLTIVIHGIINIKPHLSVSNIIRFMRDQITDSIYAQAVKIMRDDSFFFQYSAMQELGLKKIDRNCYEPGYASGAYALSYEAFNALNANQECHNVFYTFGWSGLLSTQIRYYEADILYHALTAEIELYRQQGIVPKVRIIGYSHGGYIALNLGAVFNNKMPSSEQWSVDELVLLGVPVISDTDFLVNSLLFKKVYHFYSPGDRVQVVDCLATNRFFSNRTFSSRFGFIIPDKLTQIEVRIKRLARTKLASRRCHHHKEHYPAKLLRNADPGHTELWSFGWSMGYRSYLPLYPFPVGAYLGYFINAIEKNAPSSNHITLEVRPFQEIMKITTHKPAVQSIIPFATKEQQETFADQIKPFFPDNCSKAAYQEKAHKALTLAHIQKKQEWNERKKERNAPYLRKFRKAHLDRLTQA